MTTSSCGWIAARALISPVGSASPSPSLLKPSKVTWRQRPEVHRNPPPKPNQLVTKTRNLKSRTNSGTRCDFLRTYPPRRLAGSMASKLNLLYQATSSSIGLGVSLLPGKGSMGTRATALIPPPKVKTQRKKRDREVG